jgi:hypothetical protein
MHFKLQGLEVFRHISTSPDLDHVNFGVV